MMKTKLKQLFLLAVILIMSSTTVFATSGFNYMVHFKINVQTQYDNPDKDWDPEGMRKPGKPIIGTIDSENGIQIPGLDKSQVVSYELYCEGSCMGSWYDEAGFLLQLSEQEGIMEIRINMPEYYLSGYLTLPL